MSIPMNLANSAAPNFSSQVAYAGLGPAKLGEFIVVYRGSCCYEMKSAQGEQGGRHHYGYLGDLALLSPLLPRHDKAVTKATLGCDIQALFIAVAG